MSDAHEGLAARLRIAREQAGLSQGQTAKLLSMHRPTVSEIEAGRRRVQAEEIAAFAKIYHVSASWILGEEAGDEDERDMRVRLAARELSKLKTGDFDRVMNLLASLRPDNPKGKKR
jgi:transcriptional regulator with XRE-family HTH domain